MNADKTFLDEDLHEIHADSILLLRVYRGNLPGHRARISNGKNAHHATWNPNGVTMHGRRRPDPLEKIVFSEFFLSFVVGLGLQSRRQR